MVINPALVEYQNTLVAQPLARAATLMGYCGETNKPNQYILVYQYILSIQSFHINAYYQRTL